MNETELQVLDIYDTSLVIPTVKPTKLFILCPVGLVGAGKTTVTKPLSEKLHLVRISGDEIRKLLKDKGQGYENTFKIGSVLAEKYLKLGYSIAIDSDCASDHTQKLIAKAGKEYNAMPVWIRINPPEEFILKKLRNFKHTWLFKDAEQAIQNYMERKPLHENLKMPFSYTFDTSKRDIQNQINEALHIIEKKTS